MRSKSAQLTSAGSTTLSRPYLVRKAHTMPRSAFERTPSSLLFIVLFERKQPHASPTSLGSRQGWKSAFMYGEKRASICSSESCICCSGMNPAAVAVTTASRERRVKAKRLIDGQNLLQRYE